MSWALAAPATQPAVNLPPPFYLAAPTPPDERGRAQQPQVVNATLPPKTIEEKASEDGERAWRHKIDISTLAGTAATILVLIAQGVAFVFQAHRLKQSVDAEKRTVDTMEQTARRQLKAYVFLGERKINGLLGEGGVTPEVELVFTNHGQTPAYNVRARSSFDWAQSPDKLTLVTSAELVAFGNLGPGGVLRLKRHIPPPTPEQREKMSKTLTLFIHGRLEYEDAFGNRSRWLTFSTMTGGALAPLRETLAWCQSGNETDAPE